MIQEEGEDVRKVLADEMERKLREELAVDNTYNIPENPMPAAAEITKRWEASGLLEKLSGPDRPRCAAQLTLGAEWMEKHKRFLSPFALGLFIPFVRRMYDPLKGPDFRMYARFLNTFALCGNGKMLEDLMSYFAIDLEMEYVNMCEHYIRMGMDINFVKKEGTNV